MIYVALPPTSVHRPEAALADSLQQRELVAPLCLVAPQVPRQQGHLLVGVPAPTTGVHCAIGPRLLLQMLMRALNRALRQSLLLLLLLHLLRLWLALAPGRLRIIAGLTLSGLIRGG